VWFTELRTVLIISVVVLFAHFIVDIYNKKGMLYQVKQLNNILLK